MTTDDRGRRAEAVAAWWLRLRGFRILARRYRTPVGELDLVAKRGGLMVFVEVKRRASTADAAAAVSLAQRRRIGRAAAAFLARHGAADAPHTRYDVIAVAPWQWPCHVVDAWRENDLTA
ncbi:MAG: YraN family protein [Pseudomonadota bacterium]